jgi:hypothetical protein
MDEVVDREFSLQQPQADDRRARLLIDEVIVRHVLKLGNMTVLTEMGSGPFLYTPFLAAIAGADEVICVVKDSVYAGRSDIIRRGEQLAEEWSVRDKLEIVKKVTPAMIARSHIITNLGFVRPIDARMIGWMKPGTVIPYMREVWEYRPEDVDLRACREKGILVMGTAENQSPGDVLAYCGPLAAKMLFALGFEVMGNRILVVGNDPIAIRIAEYLAAMGASAGRITERTSLSSQGTCRIDCVLLAGVATSEALIGLNGWIDAAELARLSPGCPVIQFAGKMDAITLADYGIPFVPQPPVEAHHMARTLAYLGPKPVIDLHGAGLKVGELMRRQMLECADAAVAERKLAHAFPLCQAFPAEMTGSA